MASRWINAILWTLVGVNLIALVLGGLVTWLAHTIPVRLKQSGLSPEITQAAGFASLLVACLGLCALNYSSHYALNAYGLSCAIFLVLMLFGLLPESWQRVLFLHNPSTGDQLSSRGDAAAAANHSQASIAAAVAAANRQQQQHNSGGLLLVVLHFALLALLAAVLSFAFILARYLRRKQGANDERDQDVRRQPRPGLPFGGASIDCGTPSCTCSLGGGGGGQVASVSARTTMGQPGRAPNHHSAAYANNGLHLDDIQVMPYAGAGDSGAWRGPSNYSAMASYARNEGSAAAANMERFLPPLISRGIYRSETREQLDDSADEYNQQLDGGGRSRAGGRRHRAGARPASSLSHRNSNNNNNHNNDNQCRVETDNRCRCDPAGAEAPSPNGVAASLAAKLNQDHQHTLKSQYYNTMPNNLGELTSVYAIKSAMALAQRRAMEAKRKKAAKASSGGSMMAMTAAAAAALFGGVVDSSTMHQGGGGGAGLDVIDTNMDDGLHGLTDDNFAEALMNHHYQGGDGYNFDNNHLAPGGGGGEQKHLDGGGPAFDFGVYK